MDPIRSSTELLRLLVEVEKHGRAWRTMLTRVADKELRLGIRDQERFLALNRKIRQLMTDITKDFVEIRIIHTEVDTSWGQLPEGIRSSYQQLHERVYGSRSLSIGDNIGKAQAKALRGRMTTGKDEVRGGAKPGKKYSAGVRNVVLDHQAWEFKRTIDRRLRAISSDVRTFLGGADESVKCKMCSTCGKIGELDWSFCSRCGKEMVLHERAS